MSQSHYIARLQQTWDELAALIARAHHVGFRAMTSDELSRLDRLYRATTVQLAQARIRIHNEAMLQNLNRLVSKAHSLIYIAPKRHPLRQALMFYLEGFARTVARTGRFHLVALLLFVAGLVGGYAASMQQPLAAYALLGGEDIRLPGASTQQLLDVLRHGRDTGGGLKLVFASFLFTHNTKVGFLAFAAGILAAVPTVFLVLVNGGMLGAFIAVHVQKGIQTEMYAWLLPHGITEITAVILCAGSGLMLGMAVIRPGFDTRRRALGRAGREALNMLLGVVPMFVFAGIVESFVRQSFMDTSTRLLFAAGTALFWLVYFLNGYSLERRGRRRTESRPGRTITDDSAL